MVEQTVQVYNRAGIHARPASMIVKTAHKFEAELFFERDEVKVNGKSIMGIITLGAAFRTELKVITDGPDEVEALAAIVDLFERRFEE